MKIHMVVSIFFTIAIWEGLSLITSLTLGGFRASGIINSSIVALLVALIFFMLGLIVKKHSLALPVMVYAAICLFMVIALYCVIRWSIIGTVLSLGNGLNAGILVNLIFSSVLVVLYLVSLVSIISLIIAISAILSKAS